MAPLKAIPVAVLCVSFLSCALALTCYECNSANDPSCMQATVQSSWKTISCANERELTGVDPSEYRCLRAHYTEENVPKVTRICGHELFCKIVPVLDSNITDVKCHTCDSDLCNV